MNIEGAVMNVCSECARFGTTPSTWSRIPKKAVRREVQVVEARKEPKRAAPPATLVEEELIENYGEVIRCARERLGLSQEDLAKLVKEKLSVIKRVEAGRMEPPKQLAERLEKVLKIKLYTSESVVAPSRAAKKKGLTLGDVVQLKE